jgi:hypothetical protein
MRQISRIFHVAVVVVPFDSERQLALKFDDLSATIESSFHDLTGRCEIHRDFQ